MANKSPQQTIEFFHLIFLRVLSSKLSKNLYALKGGCNLRFFLKSIRYSEDLDLDIKTVAKETLRKKIHGILESNSLNQILQVNGISINSITEPKQSETVQRWKISLALVNKEISLPTKIEFSRRGFSGETEFGPVEPEIINRYKLYTILLSHYSKESQFLQKIQALANRTETQARDVFDLKLLIEQGTDILSKLNLKPSEIEKALVNLSLLKYKDFKGQVVGFLEPEFQEYYGTEKRWEETVQKVSSTLEGLK